MEVTIQACFNRRKRGSTLGGRELQRHELPAGFDALQSAYPLTCGSTRPCGGNEQRFIAVRYAAGTGSLAVSTLTTESSVPRVCRYSFGPTIRPGLPWGSSAADGRD